MLMATLLLLACGTPEEEAPRGPLTTGTTPSTTTTDDTATVPDTTTGPTFTATTTLATSGTTAATGGADTGLYAYDCSQPNPAVGTAQGTDFLTEEDFDFDPRGFMVSQRGNNIEALDAKGQVHIYAANIGSDPAGLRVLSTGDLVVAQPDLGGVLWVDAKTGAKTAIASGLSFPNALAVDRDAYVFVSEYSNNGRVIQYDPYTGDQWAVVGNLDRPNGIELSPDEQRLYVVEAPLGGASTVWVIPRLSDTVWGQKELFYEMGSGSFLTVGIDVCENLYLVDYSTGELFRIAQDGTRERLLDIDTFGSYSSVRFGNGTYGWERTDLYVTRRAELYRIPIGIPGKRPVYF